VAGSIFRNVQVFPTSGHPVISTVIVVVLVVIVVFERLAGCDCVVEDSASVAVVARTSPPVTVGVVTAAAVTYYYDDVRTLEVGNDVWPEGETSGRSDEVTSAICFFCINKSHRQPSLNSYTTTTTTTPI